MSVAENGERLVEEMRRGGIRVTAQRLAIADVLVSSDDHPTAQQVYGRVRERLPHLTMATVYNTINVLAKSGFVHPLPFPERTRYDANPSCHANLVCVRCGSIEDSSCDDGTMERLADGLAGKRGFQVHSQRLDFYGLCSGCAADGSQA